MIAPVGQSPNDEQLLVMALHAGLSQGFDHKKAIETLHGVNNHAANLWKDYYLEHKSRIDEMVDRLQPSKIAKKPVLIGFTPKASSTSSEIGGKQPRMGQLENASHPPLPAESGSSQGTLVPRTSDGAPTPRKRGYRSPSRHLDLPIPPPPGAEPMPPKKVVKGPRGNRYTTEDKKYFAKYISWALQVDPTLTKNDLITRLAEKVPHHSVASWTSYWGRDPLADRVLAAAQDKTSQGYDGQEVDEDAEEEDSVEKDCGWEEESGSYDSDEDEAAMGPSGAAFTAADFRVIAKYMARYSSDEWAEMTAKQRWFPFHEEHPQRSDKAWAEKYRSIEAGMRSQIILSIWILKRSSQNS
ncbi:hypothetical protein BGW80DRAFT_1262927 [Lactifluus volemus]|nr:hypothetical protein BGW80DRAFT_1262927 [Lactifluus volemus]